jgi:ADP-ribose pyrophosphatase
MEIETTGSRIVYGNRWMRVREDQIQRTNGMPGLYSVVEKLDYSLVIPRDGEGVFVVEQYRYPVRGRYWEFPRGPGRSGRRRTPWRLRGRSWRPRRGCERVP